MVREAGQHDHVRMIRVLYARQGGEPQLGIELPAVVVVAGDHDGALTCPTTAETRAATTVSRATIRSIVPRCRAASSHPGSSSRVTPAQVATGARSGNPTGAVASTASATWAER